MADVDEIIDFIKSLKRGFDKDLFQNKIEELAYAVDTTGLDYEDFHTLFKVWLNLTIPITKWEHLGCCLVPPDKVEERTVEYALLWILTNFDDQSNFSRFGFLMDWLTAAMECDSVDIAALDSGYEVFYTMLTFDVLTVHAIKLVYTLTKPMDVTRSRVIELLDYAKNREGKKSLYHQLQVLLGLFKSYKPQCVPEDVPAISIHTAFKKLNVTLLSRYKRLQERRNRRSNEKQHLLWINPINERGRNKKAFPLLPNIEFTTSNSGKHTDKEMPKNLFDFTDPVSLIHYSLQYPMARPARLRALLCNATSQTMLAIISHSHQAFLAHDLCHLLESCFLDVSRNSYYEKQDLLRRLAVFQRTLAQGVPGITRFLAQFLPLWNERDYFPEILELVEWVSIDCPDHIQYIVDVLGKVYHRAQPMEQCAILNSLTNMYTNLVYATTKRRQHFLSSQPSATNYEPVLVVLAEKITEIYSKGLQVNPDDMRVLYSAINSNLRCARAELSYGACIGALPSTLVLALSILNVSPFLINKIAELLILYKKVMSATKSRTKESILNVLSSYMTDLINSLYSEEAIKGRKDGLIFQNLHPQLASKLGSIIPDVDAKLSIRNHLAFAPYTYIHLVAIDHRDASNNMLFHAVIDQNFKSLSRFLKSALSELRHQ